MISNNQFLAPSCLFIYLKIYLSVSIYFSFSLFLLLLPSHSLSFPPFFYFFILLSSSYPSTFPTLITVPFSSFLSSNSVFLFSLSSTRNAKTRKQKNIEGGNNQPFLVYLINATSCFPVFSPSLTPTHNAKQQAEKEMEVINLPLFIQ